MVLVARIDALVTAVPDATSTSTGRRTSSAARSGRRSICPPRVAPLDGDGAPLEVAVLCQALPEGILVLLLTAGR
jgi:hypothetical protein